MRKIIIIIFASIIVYTSIAKAFAQILGMPGIVPIVKMCNPMFPPVDQPATSYAIIESQTIYNALCETYNCGQYQLFANCGIQNAACLPVQPGLSIIRYNPDYMNYVYNLFKEPATFAIMAHEMGHHMNHLNIMNFHPVIASDRWREELRADAWAGCALAKTGKPPGYAQIFLDVMVKYASASHPPSHLRKQALIEGYQICGGTIPLF